jgi:anti-sigma regulatory factor (Ser/Thr protein kinase)
MDILADEPPVLVCDLDGMATTTQALVEMCTPITCYLKLWPGTILVLSASDPVVYERMLQIAIPKRLLVDKCPEAGIAEARALVQPVQHEVTYLPPVPSAAPEARAFTTQTLRRWGMESMTWNATVVASELATNAIVHQRSVLDLALSRVGTRLRIAVHDHGGGLPAHGNVVDDESVTGRGFALVDGLTLGWGVFPSLPHGKTVWAILDAA